MADQFVILRFKEDASPRKVGYAIAEAATEEVLGINLTLLDPEDADDVRTVLETDHGIAPTMFDNHVIVGT